MRSKKLVVLPLILLFALSLTGYAFAGWSDTLTINGTVSTATLDLTFSYVGPVDELGTDPSNLVTTTLVPSGETTGVVHTVTMTIDNAYPNYKARFAFEVTNIGTIPARFLGFNLNGGPVSYTSPGGWTASLPDGSLTFVGRDGEGEMLPVGDDHNYSFKVVVNAAAEAGATYTFTIGVVFEQGV